MNGTHLFLCSLNATAAQSTEYFQKGGGFLFLQDRKKGLNQSTAKSEMLPLGLCGNLVVSLQEEDTDEDKKNFASYQGEPERVFQKTTLKMQKRVKQSTLPSPSRL